ncbi:hypothetical protein KQY30_17780 [Streptomyces sp. GMY02]|nr:hypothetical protein KQY30_17780 [Streptomyces sp. GMY02]
MSALPVHQHRPDRVPRNGAGTAAALDSVKRIEFYRELLVAAPEEAEAILKRWWCEAMLDTAPGGDRLTLASLNGTLPTMDVITAIERRRSAGLPVE